LRATSSAIGAARFLLSRSSVERRQPKPRCSMRRSRCYLQRAAALDYSLAAAENECVSQTSCAVTAPHASIALALSSFACACAAVGYRFLRSAIYLSGDR
jgi:hypothetical protein